MDAWTDNENSPGELDAERGNMLAPSRDQGNTGTKEEWNVRTAFGGKGLQLPDQRFIDFTVIDLSHGKKRCGRIARSAAESGTGRDALFDGYLCAGFIVRKVPGIESAGFVDDVLLGV